MKHGVTPISMNGMAKYDVFQSRPCANKTSGVGMVKCQTSSSIACCIFSQEVLDHSETNGSDL